MKKTRPVLLILSLLCISACSTTKAANNDTTKAEPEALPEYNIPELEKYNAFVNQTAVANGISTFLWDCSIYMDRKALYNKYPTCIQAIVDAYPKRDYVGNGGNNDAFEEEDAITAVANFGPGWNLGNTLDSTSFNINNVATGEEGWIIKYGKKDINGNLVPAAWETAWGQPVTYQEVADFILEAGFTAIRIPVTWAEHFDENDNVDPAWMARVKETVDCFYNRGVYCIVNAHHDGGADGWIEATEASYNNYNQRFAKLWTQISTTFADYDERLLFESMNEVLDGGNNWGQSGAGQKWINKWNQLFVDTVRSTGGNNAKRNLVIMPYAGNGDLFNLTHFEIPQDSAANHLIIEVHNYNPQTFCWTNVTWAPMTAKWNASFEQQLRGDYGIYKKFADNFGIPFIVGEYCADPKKYSEY